MYKIIVDEVFIKGIGLLRKGEVIQKTQCQGYQNLDVLLQEKKIKQIDMQIEKSAPTEVKAEDADKTTGRGRGRSRSNKEKTAPVSNGYVTEPAAKVTEATDNIADGDTDVNDDGVATDEVLNPQAI